MNETVNLFTPLMQFGFAGLCLILLVFLFWVVTKLVTILDQNNKIIAANTHAIIELRKTTAEELEIIRELKDKLIQRPCLRDP